MFFVHTVQQARCFLFALVLGVPLAASAAPTITGNTISWPNDGWYQVQVVTDEGQTQVCGGTRFCEVSNGTYIVINHTTGERFENIVVNADSVMSEITVTGNTISWPDNGWYQVQVVNDEGQTQVCAGTRFCEVSNGTYIVINHTTGQRFENIVVSADPAMSEVIVTGNTISWPDDGWYQVQVVTDKGQTQVCGGTRFCEVPDGTYIVINHTTGERFEPVIVDSGAVDPEDLPIIRADNWQEILRNVVALTNADRALERHDMILDRVKSLSEVAYSAWQFEVNGVPDSTAGTLASLGLTMLSAADDFPLIVDFSCDAGGDLTLNIYPYVIYSSEANNCAIGGDVYDGDFYYYRADRADPFSKVTDMTVSLVDSTRFSLSGSLDYFYARGGYWPSVEWIDASMSEQSGDENYFVEAFNMLSEAAHYYRHDLIPPPGASADGAEGIAEYYEHSAAVTGSFTVSAPWTDNRVMEVSTNLMLGGTFRLTDATPVLPIPDETVSGELVWPASETSSMPSQWTSGSIDVIAADGSRLSLRPMPDDATSALVDVSGISEPQQVLWSDGFQVRCFGNHSSYVDCQ